MRIVQNSVPIDNKAHLYNLSGPIVHLEWRTPNELQFWALDDGNPTTDHAFMVIGTDQETNQPFEYIGTAKMVLPSAQVTGDPYYVWHLIEVEREVEAE